MRYQNIKPGGQISAAKFNAAMRDLDRLVSQLNQIGGPSGRFRLMRITDPVTVGSSESKGKLSRRAVNQIYQTETDSFIDGDILRDIREEPYNLPLDQDETVLCMYHEQGGFTLPVMGPRTIRHAITVRDEDGMYPLENASDPPDTYPIKFVRLEFCERNGNNGHTLEYLQADTDLPDTWVHNLASAQTVDYTCDNELSGVPAGYIEENSDTSGADDIGIPPTGDYIPVGKIIACYCVTDQWFTVTPAVQPSSPFFMVVQDASAGYGYVIAHWLYWNAKKGYYITDQNTGDNKIYAVPAGLSSQSYAGPSTKTGDSGDPEIEGFPYYGNSDNRNIARWAKKGFVGEAKWDVKRRIWTVEKIEHVARWINFAYGGSDSYSFGQVDSNLSVTSFWGGLDPTKTTFGSGGQTNQVALVNSPDAGFAIGGQGNPTSGTAVWRDDLDNSAAWQYQVIDAGCVQGGA